MKRPSISLLLGCLLVGVAGILVATRNGSLHEAAGEPPSIRSRERHPRPVSGISASRLLASTRQQSSASREAWAKSLDDAELKRLTRAMIAAYLDEANSQGDVAAWLVPLAKEWGRRDIDGLFFEASALLSDDFSGQQFACLNGIRAAALIGLSETDPQKASQILLRPNEGDFIHSDSNTPVVAETVFRNWAKQDPAQAWQELSSSFLMIWDSAAGIRGLIAGSPDSDLHQETLRWITDRKRQSEEAAPLPDDAAVTRNSIDAILNNPNRFSFESLVSSAALGMAEHDTEKAWKWLNSQSHTSLGDIPVIGRLFPNSGTVKFLSDWAERQPQEVIAFMNLHQDQITPGHRVGTASALFSREPESALEVLARIPDFGERESAVTDWITSAVRSPAITEWPLVEGIPSSLTASESVRRVMENLDRLGLSESETAALHLKLEKLSIAPSREEMEPQFVR